MKKLLLISAIALSISTAYADNTATGTVTATGKVITSLSIAAATLTMPDLVVPAAGEGDSSVTLGCTDAGAGSVSYTGNGNPFAHNVAGAAGVNAASANKGATDANFTGTCADLVVGGETDYHFLVTTEGTPTAGAGLTYSPLACETTGNLTAGAGNVYCGITVIAAAGATVGTYTVTGDVIITYD